MTPAEELDASTLGGRLWLQGGFGSESFAQFAAGWFRTSVAECGTLQFDGGSATAFAVNATIPYSATVLATVHNPSPQIVCLL